MAPTPPQALEQLGIAVKKRREAMRLSQADLAERGGPGEATVRRLERGGEGGEPRARTQEQFEAALAWPRGTVRAILEKAIENSNGPNIVYSGLGQQSIAIRDKTLAEALNTELGIEPVNVGDTLTLTVPETARAALVVAGSITPEASAPDDPRPYAYGATWARRQPVLPRTPTFNVATQIDISKMLPNVKLQPIVPPTVLAGLRVTGPASAMQSMLDEFQANLTRAFRVDVEKLLGTFNEVMRVDPIEPRRLVATPAPASSPADRGEAEGEQAERTDDADPAGPGAEIVFFPVAYEAEKEDTPAAPDQLSDIQLVGELVKRLTAGGQRDNAERVALNGLLPLLGRLNDETDDGPQQLGSG